MYGENEKESVRFDGKLLEVASWTKVGEDDYRIHRIEDTVVESK